MDCINFIAFWRIGTYKLEKFGIRVLGQLRINLYFLGIITEQN